MAHFATTLSALATPRRSLPIAAVTASLVAVELCYGDWRTALVPLGMSLAFVVLAPWSWRAAAGALGVARYLAGAVAVVAVFGIALPRALALGPTYFTDPGSLSVAVVLYGVGGWGLGRDIELEQDLEDVRLKAIRAHLDPHFLYNTLNAIAEWCAEDPRVAEAATARLADMLRAILEGLEQRRWPLARELALVEDLLELHLLRDADAFTTRIEADCTGGVPPLVLVFVVENAIKPGPRAVSRRIAFASPGRALAARSRTWCLRHGSGGRGLATSANGRARGRPRDHAEARDAATLELP